MTHYAGISARLAEDLESKGLPGASVIGMLEVYYRSRKTARSSEEEEDIRPDQALDPPYKDMIAMAFNLRLLQDHKSGRESKTHARRTAGKNRGRRQGDYAAMA